VPRGPVGRAPEAAQLRELLEGIATGNESAFTEFYDATSSRVYGAVLHILRSPGVAAEVTQQVYLAIWRQPCRYDPAKGSVLAWMMAMAHRYAIDRARTLSKEPSDGRYTANGDRLFDRLSNEIETRFDADQAREALRSLPEVQRQAVRLVYFNGYSQTEVARLLGLPLGTVKSRIRDGLIGLRNALGVGT
jgi:RNA polymerase sigma-70 factor, ECF subfamily